MEALEFNVAPGLPFIGVPLKDLTLRKGLLVAGIVLLAIGVVLLVRLVRRVAADPTPQFQE